mmetsp:Transcript_23899/g.77913  ORF Transcript_23899/g.77913 Transcript_23899/m.77913 type:complete len:307 (+) Transcript_23899:718-1638(+)
MPPLAGLARGPQTRRKEPTSPLARPSGRGPSTVWQPVWPLRCISLQYSSVRLSRLETEKVSTGGGPRARVGVCRRLGAGTTARMPLIESSTSPVAGSSVSCAGGVHLLSHLLPVLMRTAFAARIIASKAATSGGVSWSHSHTSSASDSPPPSRRWPHRRTSSKKDSKTHFVQSPSAAFAALEAVAGLCQVRSLSAARSKLSVAPSYVLRAAAGLEAHCTTNAPGVVSGATAAAMATVASAAEEEPASAAEPPASAETAPVSGSGRLTEIVGDGSKPTTFPAFLPSLEKTLRPILTPSTLPWTCRFL